ncbi:hypothetical protein M8J76_003358 [Diaphorina citri]|nr:hypothetical protein M8J76_003358 [Diaphorina citri]
MQILLLLFIVFLSHATRAAIIIGTWSGGFQQAVQAGAAQLGQGGSSLDAVEAACSTCEELQCDGTVGYGGSPDEHGETTLDAMIMDGTRMNIGAVAALRRVKNAIGVARKVLENTKHTMLVGDQAKHFAVSMGFPEESLTTPDSKHKWRAWRDNRCQPNFWTSVKPDPKTSCGPYKPLSFAHRLDRDTDSNVDIGRYNHDTIGVVAIDARGDIAAGTRAGAYAETGVGGAAATGDGDIMMRFLPSFLTVELLRSGEEVTAAVRTAVQRIAHFYPDFSGAVIGVDKEGRYAAACHGMQEFPYVVGEEESGEWRTVVKYVTCI